MSSKVQAQPAALSAHTLSESVISAMQEIVSDRLTRIAGYAEDKSLLDGGIWLPLEYYDALKEMGQTKRIQWFRKRGDFYHGFYPPKQFEMMDKVDRPTGKVVHIARIKEGQDPVVAHHKLKEGPALIDCLNTCQLACFEAVLSAVGEEKFRAIFSADDSFYALDQLGRVNSSIMRLLERFSPEEKEPIRGDLIYIQNVRPDQRYWSYGYKHLHGSGSGQSLVYLGEGKVIGLATAGATIKEIGEKLLESYNADPRTDEHMTEEHAQAHTPFSKQLRETRRARVSEIQLTPKRFKEFGGGKIMVCHRLRFDRIQQLVEAPLDEVGALFASFK